MKIKKWENFNINEKTNAAKAIAAGYNYGDKVYNKKMDKIITIADPNRPTNTYGDDYCSLGAVGQFLDNYRKISDSKIKTEFSVSEKAREVLKNI